MTHKRSWLALGALLAAIVGGTVWAAEQEKKPTDQAQTTDCCAEPAHGSAVKCSATTKACCAEACATTEKTCCEGKCCSKETGKCCGCCDKAKPGVTLPVAPGSSFEVLVSPPQPGCIAPPAPVGYPGEWACPPPCPAYPPAAPAQYTPVTQYVANPSYPVPPPPPVACVPPAACRGAASPWRLRALVEKDHTCLEMQLSAAGEDARAYCDNMTLKIGNEKLTLAVVDKQIQVNGSFVKGSADAITRNTADGSILLEGHVRLKYEKDGQKAEVSGEHVAVGIADGRLEVKPVEHSQVFTFWIGGFR